MSRKLKKTLFSSNKCVTISLKELPIKVEIFISLLPVPLQRDESQQVAVTGGGKGNLE